MRKKYNKRIFAFCLALIIVAMLGVNSFAELDYNSNKDIKFIPDDSKISVAPTRPAFQIPNMDSLEFENYSIKPTGGLTYSDLEDLELMYFETVYVLNGHYSDGEGGYVYYWEGYTCNTSNGLYALAIYDLHIANGHTEIELGIKRVADDSWLYIAEYGWDINKTYEMTPVIWYVPEIAIMQGPPSERDQIAQRVLKLCPCTSLTEDNSVDIGSYNQGYQDGLADATNEGIGIGFQEGKAQGYAIGYTEGYNANENSNPFKSLINAVVFTPINAVMNMLNFDLFGINMRGIVLTLLTALIVIAIVVILWKKVT